MDVCNFPGFLSTKGAPMAKAQLVVLLCNVETRNAWASRMRGFMTPDEREAAQKIAAEAITYINAQSEALLRYV